MIFFFVMIISSTHDNYNIVAKINVLPGDKLKDNFDRLTQNIDLTRGILNSLMLAVVVTVVQNYFTMMAAYAFSKFQFKGNRAKVREQAVVRALDLLRRAILEQYR